MKILDSTLREGEQTPGVYFPEHVKLEIARLLDRLGVDFIEAGHPAVTPEIQTAVTHIAAQNFRARIAAHSRSLKKDVDLAIACGVQFLGIFYCVSDERLTQVFRTDLTRAINNICDVIAYARQQKPDLLIRFTPEDTVRSRFENVVFSAAAAVEAGADIISIADTTGYMIPRSERSFYDYILRLREALERRGLSPLLAVHCHNDRGLALANALSAYEAGADIIDASVLGLGERAGIVDLATLLAVLHQDFGEGEQWNLEVLVPLYHLVSRYSGTPIPKNFPVVGENAFRHCAGVHTHAAQVNPLHYQSLDPAPFGREMEITLDHMSGLSTVQYALEQIGEEIPERETLLEILAKIKAIGQTGRTVDQEEFKLIVRWIKSQRKEPVYAD